MPNLQINGQNWGRGMQSASALGFTEGDSVRNLNEVAKFAFGTKNKSENASGGHGRIGLDAQGRLIKFETGVKDRLFTRTTDEMRASCHALRKNLLAWSESYLRSISSRLDGGNGLRFQKELDGIRRKLGMNADEVAKTSTKLLDRKIVASVLNDLAKVNEQALKELGDRRAYARGNQYEVMFEHARSGGADNADFRERATEALRRRNEADRLYSEVEHLEIRKPDGRENV